MADEVNENIFLLMHLLEVEKQPGLDNKLKVTFYIIPRIIFYVLLIQIALQKSWEEIWSRAEYILEQYIVL